jgi:hypothetical protein
MDIEAVHGTCRVKGVTQGAAKVVGATLGAVEVSKAGDEGVT